MSFRERPGFSNLASAVSQRIKFQVAKCKTEQGDMQKHVPPLRFMGAIAHRGRMCGKSTVEILRVSGVATPARICAND
jgi:hypothetical protein